MLGFKPLPSEVVTTVDPQVLFQQTKLSSSYSVSLNSSLLMFNANIAAGDC